LNVCTAQPRSKNGWNNFLRPRGRFAATVAIVLGPIFLGLLAGWIFNQFGWEQAGKSVAFSGLYYIYFTGAIAGILAGVAKICPA
jgi:hypothetical protein